jgi:hypothetical protein
MTKRKAFYSLSRAVEHFDMLEVMGLEPTFARYPARGIYVVTW